NARIKAVGRRLCPTSNAVTRCASAFSAVACSAVDAGNACIQASTNGYSSGAEGTRILRVLGARHPQFPASRALLPTHSCPLLWRSAVHAKNLGRRFPHVDSAVTVPKVDLGVVISADARCSGG